MTHAHLARASLGLFVSRVLPARPAKLLGLQAVGMFLFILGGGVIPVLALTTLQGNDFPHPLILLPKPSWSEIRTITR
jgi:hypothetical protein